MTWFSILPDNLSYLETWIVKVFVSFPTVLAVLG